MIDMNYRREHRASRSALFDGHDTIEEGGIRAATTFARQGDEHENDRALDSLHDRVSFLKKLTGDIHEEVESHNRALDKMGNAMDATRGIITGTMDRFKKVFEKKSRRTICVRVVYFIIGFLVLYYLTRVMKLMYA